MSVVRYELFQEQHLESQGKMMARVFETLLHRHPQIVPEAIEKFTCLSATDYNKNLEALRSAPAVFQNKTTCLIEGQTVCIGTSVGMAQKKSFISRLFRLCGEDERQFKIIEGNTPIGKENASSQRKANVFRADGIGYTLFGEHMFSTQADMMCWVFERVFREKPEIVDWAVSNLKCLSWTNYTSCIRKEERPPYNFKNCRMITAGDHQLCVGTNYGIKAKSAFLDRLIRQAGLPADVFRLDSVRPPKLYWWQSEAVQGILEHLPKSSQDDKRVGFVSMPTGTGKSVVIGELIRQIFQEQKPSWSVLILTSTVDLSYQYQEMLKGLLEPSHVIDRPAKVSELPALIGIPRTVLCTTSQSLLNRSSAEPKSFFNPPKTEPFSASDRLLVIIDEIAVGFISRIFLEMHDRFPIAAFLGFTADPTPDERLFEAYGSMIFQYTYDDAVLEGRLNPICYENMMFSEPGIYLDNYLQPNDAWYFETSEERLNRIAELILTRERSSERRILVLCSNWEEATKLYNLLIPNLSSGRLQLANASIPIRVIERMPLLPVSWDGRSFPGCIVLSCTVTAAFPFFDVVYLNRKVQSSFAIARILSVLMKQDGKRQETGRLVDLYNSSYSIVRILPSAAMLPSNRDDFPPTLGSYVEQIESALESRQFELAQDLLSQFRAAFPNKSGAISEQLAFLEPPNGQNASLYWRQHADSLAWYGDLWRLLRQDAPQASNQEGLSELAEEPAEAPDALYPAAASTGTPQDRGAQLERAAKELIRQLFSIPEEENQQCLEELRVQGAGYQFGFDVTFTYRDAYGAMVHCRVECKNFQEHEIRLDDIAGKLVSASAQEKIIDHWILLSPTGKVSNELWNLQERWRKSGTWYPILDVQFWTADQNVGELFALFPLLYQQFYERNPENGPASWNEEHRRMILTKWRDKLTPVPHLPPNWIHYLQDSKCLLMGQETDLNTICCYEELYDCRVPMSLFDQNELPIDGTAEDYFLRWLQRTDSPCALLLGDFGDGKTFFTYTLARRLVKDFLASPTQGVIPLRISLQRLGEQERSCRDILDHRMREFSDGIREWNEVQGRYRFLVILDGLDEMSQSMSDTAVLRNLSILEELIEQFKGHKLLVTSRKMVIYSDRIRQRILTSLGGPEVLHLAPVAPSDRIAFLRKMADTPSRQQRLVQIRQTHDLLGLASKPLFLDMMRVQLDSGNVMSMDPAGIYLYYAKEVLLRKQQQIDLQGDVTHPYVIQQRLLELLEKLALCLYQRGVESISLEDFKTQTGQNNLAKYLWDCADMAQGEDADVRVSNRSLLKYDSVDYNKRCFCHRSMKEYFIAQGIVHQLLNDENAGRTLLTGPGLGYEILSFAGDILRTLDDAGKAAASRRLVTFAHEQLMTSEQVSFNLAVNSVNLLHYGNLGLPGQNWSGLYLDNVLLSGEDLSGKNFSYSSMRYAHLDNTDLTGCDLRYCDFTGVLFEKTGQLNAFAILHSEDGLLASYQDGNVRRWLFSDGSAQILAQMEHKKVLRLFLQEGGRDAMLDAKRLLFLRRGQQGLTVAGYAPLQPGMIVLDVGQEAALIRQQSALLLLKLENGECLGRMETSNIALACLLQGNMVLMWTNERGLELCDMERGKILCRINDETRSTSALAAHSLSSDRGIAVLCTVQGEIFSYDIIFDSDRGQYQMKLNGYASTGGIPVVQAAVDGGGLYIGLSTGKIIMYRRDDFDGLIANREFHLEIKCSGAKLEGVIPSEQRLTLLHAQK